MKIFVFLSVLFFSNFCFSQVLVGSVIDEQDQPLLGATILNTNSNQGVVSNDKGEFIIKAFSGDFVKISFIGKKTLVKHIHITKQDTIYMIFLLKDDISKLNAYTVSGKKVKKVSGLYNESIIDYLPLLDGKILFLKKVKKEYFLSLEETDSTHCKTIIQFEKPSKFEQDCYGNIHLLCKDKVRQLWITDTILALYENSYLQYNKFLKPLLFCNESSIFTENFINHNQRYQVQRISNFKKQRELIYETWDKEAEKIAAGWYNQIIGFYYANTSPEMNLIENGVWDGNLVSLQVDDPESNQMISWYLKVRAREMNIQGFANHEKIVLFDFRTDTVTVLNPEGKILSANQLEIDKVKSSTKIIFDKLTGKFYYFDANNIALKLIEIDPVTGKTEEKIYLKEVRYIKNLKVIDGWLYFIKRNKFGYQNLYKTLIQ